MLTINQINSATDFKNLSREDLINFLFQHLDQFGDSKEAIGKSIDYAFSTQEGKGGFILTGYLDNQLVGAVVMNKTGMDGYIPENILVYIAVDASKRGNGIGKQLMEAAIDRSQGDIALHVEYENPAKRLYERIGFGSKYAEMRFYKK
ncbi:MAG: GNAT family N-acetyltransferase [Bacteroidales bacterium]|nr:GNAT family N-acetyltransferase [Bacteroidales bacterium]MBN2747883.1 GNAT family N-acetyltransferase [Bacteroidales bacterium]